MKLQNIGVKLAKKIARGDLSQEDYRDLHELIQVIQKDLGVRFVYGPHDLSDDEAVPEAFVYERIFPFLDRTGIIISGGDLQISYGFYVDDQLYEFTYREWGYYMAEWCNANMRLRKLEYINFYMSDYVTDVFSDYSQYLSNLMKVIDYDNIKW